MSSQITPIEQHCSFCERIYLLGTHIPNLITRSGVLYSPHHRHQFRVARRVGAMALHIHRSLHRVVQQHVSVNVLSRAASPSPWRRPLTSQSRGTCSSAYGSSTADVGAGPLRRHVLLLAAAVVLSPRTAHAATSVQIGEEYGRCHARGGLVRAERERMAAATFMHG